MIHKKVEKVDFVFSPSKASGPSGGRDVIVRAEEGP